jgi:hypothetical protein
MSVFRTAIRVLHLDGDHEDIDLGDLPREMPLDLIRQHVERYLDDGQRMEHVYIAADAIKDSGPGPTIPTNGTAACMFVGEDSAGRYPFNREASRIYRFATLARQPKTDPKTLPGIFGTAVVFNRRVRF